MELLLCFIGFAKDCIFSSFSMSVSTLFLVVRFDMGEGRIRAIIEYPQSLVLLLCVEDIENGSTTIFFCIWVGPASLAVFVDTNNLPAHINFVEELDVF